jgi:hypothetical protein
MESHSHHQTSNGKFHLGFTYEPIHAKAGDLIKLSFKPVRNDSQKEVSLESVHEKYMHLLIVSEDLS